MADLWKPKNTYATDNPAAKKGYSYTKPSLLHPEGDPNQSAPGFDFNRNDFEDLIDNFTPFEDIPILLGVTHPQLDEFCLYIYNMKYKDTYDTLLRRSQLYYRKAMMSLSKSGNPSAIKVATEYYVGLGAVSDNDNHKTIINSMPDVPSDVEKLAQQKGQSQKDQIDAVSKLNELNGKG